MKNTPKHISIITQCSKLYLLTLNVFNVNVDVETKYEGKKFHSLSVAKIAPFTLPSSTSRKILVYISLYTILYPFLVHGFGVLYFSYYFHASKTEEKT